MSSAPESLAPTAAGSAAVGALDLDFLDRIVDPYRARNTIYLREAWQVPVESGVAVRGRFSIHETCYIDDTGHFNAVESLICYNQLMYAAVAVAIRDQRFSAFDGWTLDDFWRMQLPDVLIRRQSIAYHRPLHAPDFSATVRLLEADETRRADAMVRIPTTVTFADDHGGAADGTVDLVLVRCPAGVAR